MIITTGIHGRGEIGQIIGAASDFILKEQGNPTVYIVGDCLYTLEIHANIEKYRPDWVRFNSGGAIGPPLSITDGSVIINEKDVVTMIKESPDYCRFIAVHMDDIDH